MNIFVVLIPITIRGGFDKIKLPSRGEQLNYKTYFRVESKIFSDYVFCQAHLQ